MQADKSVLCAQALGAAKARATTVLIAASRTSLFLTGHEKNFTRVLIS